MTEEDNSHLFDEENFDVTTILFEQLSDVMVPLFRALTKKGLSSQEAAAITAAFVAQNVPQELQGPTDGS